MTAHRRHMHGTEPAIDWSRLLVSHTLHQPQLYDMIFQRTTKQCPCPFLGCPGYYRTWNGLHCNFNRYWGDQIRILEEHLNPLPRCEPYESQVPEGRLSNRYYMSEK